MANDLITANNPFLRAAGQLRSSGKIERQAIAASTIPRASRARLNFIPDADTLSAMIDRARHAFAQGRIWDRGAILNLVV